MISTLFVSGVLKFSAWAFAASTQNLVDKKTLREAKQAAAKNGSELNIIEPKLALTDEELTALNATLKDNPLWKLGCDRAEAQMRRGAL